MSPPPIVLPIARGAPGKGARRTFSKATAPSLAWERHLWADGHEVVVGMDEVGRGAWAGPLMVGAAVLPQDRRVYKVRDSKMLSEAEREALFDKVAGWCIAWAVGAASQVECDTLGMAEAQRIAARRALDGLGLAPDRVLVDGNWDFVGRGSTQRIIKGDAICLSISTASILAKVTRDRIMRAEAPHFPAYDFDCNKGYPVPAPQDGAAGVWPDVDPSAKLGFHGSPAVDQPALLPTSAIDTLRRAERMSHHRARVAALAVTIILLGLGATACTGSDNGGVILPPAGTTTTVASTSTS